MEVDEQLYQDLDIDACSVTTLRAVAHTQKETINLLSIENQGLESQRALLEADNRALVQELLELRSQQLTGAMANPAPPQLPPGVKLDKPRAYTGVMDGDVLRAFLFSVERYFALVGLIDGNQQAQFLSMLLVDHAALWLQHQNYNWGTVNYATIKAAMESYFVPADSQYSARTQLAACKQTGNVHGYIAAFTKAALRVSNLSEAEKLDKFLRGLKPAVFERVILLEPRDFAAAAKLAARTSTTLQFAAEQAQTFGRQTQTSVVDTSMPGGPDVGPMVLGNARGGFGRSRGTATAAGRRGRSNFNRARAGAPFGARANARGPKFDGECYYCGKYGHKSRDCFQKSRQGRLQGLHGAGAVQLAGESSAAQQGASAPFNPTYPPAPNAEQVFGAESHQEN